MNARHTPLRESYPESDPEPLTVPVLYPPGTAYWESVPHTLPEGEAARWGVRLPHPQVPRHLKRGRHAAPFLTTTKLVVASAIVAALVAVGMVLAMMDAPVRVVADGTPIAPPSAPAAALAQTSVHPKVQTKKTTAPRTSVPTRAPANMCVVAVPNSDSP